MSVVNKINIFIVEYNVLIKIVTTHSRTFVYIYIDSFSYLFYCEEPTLEVCPRIFSTPCRIYIYIYIFTKPYMP